MNTTICSSRIVESILPVVGINSGNALSALLLMSMNDGIYASSEEDRDDDEDSDVPDNDEILSMMFPDEDDDYWTGNYDVN